MTLFRNRARAAGGSHRATANRPRPLPPSVHKASLRPYTERAERQCWRKTLSEQFANRSDARVPRLLTPRPEQPEKQARETATFPRSQRPTSCWAARPYSPYAKAAYFAKRER